MLLSTTKETGYYTSLFCLLFLVVFSIRTPTCFNPRDLDGTRSRHLSANPTKNLFVPLGFARHTSLHFSLHFGLDVPTFLFLSVYIKTEILSCVLKNKGDCFSAVSFALFIATARSQTSHHIRVMDSFMVLSFAVTTLQFLLYASGSAIMDTHATAMTAFGFVVA